MIKLMLCTIFMTLFVIGIFSGLIQYPGAMVAIGAVLGPLAALWPSIQMAMTSGLRERRVRVIQK